MNTRRQSIIAVASTSIVFILLIVFLCKTPDIMHRAPEIPPPTSSASSQEHTRTAADETIPAAVKQVGADSRANQNKPNALSGAEATYISDKNQPGRIRNLITAATAHNEPDSAIPEEEPFVIRRRLVRIDLNQLADIKSGSDDIVKLDLFDDVSFDAVIEHVERPYGNSILYKGKIAGKPHSIVVIVINEGVLAANIRTPEDMYETRYLGNGFYEVIDIDESKLPQCGGPIIPEQ